MRIVDPNWKIIMPVGMTVEGIYEHIRFCGSAAYRSDPVDANAFIRKIVQRGHFSVIEHVSITVSFGFDRGVSHELVRHRIAAYTQESTRFCNFSAGKFGGHVTFVKPVFYPKIPCGEYSKYKVDKMLREGIFPKREIIWLKTMLTCERAYFDNLIYGGVPQEARDLLPNSLYTVVNATYNLREWRHVFKMRTAVDAHPQMREIMVPVHEEFKRLMPEIYTDVSKE